jgi:hypothetical protein
MRLERGQKPKARRFQGEKAPFLRMQENRKELRCNLWVYGSTKQGDKFLMEEMADAGKNHGHSETVGGGDDVIVADRASWLNDGNGAGFGGFLDAIREREKSV